VAQGRSTKIISMIEWTRTSRLSIEISLSLGPCGGPGEGAKTTLCPSSPRCLPWSRSHVTALEPVDCLRAKKRIQSTALRLRALLVKHRSFCRSRDHGGARMGHTPECEFEQPPFQRVSWSILDFFTHGKAPISRFWQQTQILKIKLLLGETPCSEIFN